MNYLSCSDNVKPIHLECLRDVIVGGSNDKPYEFFVINLLLNNTTKKDNLKIQYNYKCLLRDISISYGQNKSKASLREPLITFKGLKVKMVSCGIFLTLNSMIIFTSRKMCF